MMVVIVGAKDRISEDDRKQVGELVEQASVAYPSCLFVTMITHMGIGKYVKEKCLEKDSRNKFKYPFVEVVIHVCAANLSSSEASNIYIARNATVFELGDCFYYFASPSRRGSLEELIQNRVVPSGRPCQIILPGETFTVPLL